MPYFLFADVIKMSGCYKHIRLMARTGLLMPFDEEMGGAA